ncbi:hypothetical protein LPU83_pLPU83c_0514 (plasmid) [Rhizobium favelukesii]|uniref:Uncharacterized protein n=1 Tax=Rhizobium favelukesii TaxID=348824 RepID=W6S431_9HYPH|nr:hypothetical protein LPU83_pLPU83c_0514 [Rhizobium favelukesii]
MDAIILDDLERREGSDLTFMRNQTHNSAISDVHESR